MDEKEIIKKLKQGKKEYFTEIIKKYKGVVYNHVYSYLRNKEETEDTTQEIFINIYKNIKKFRGDSKLSTWIYRITVNVCKNKLKQLNRKKNYLIDEQEEEDMDRHIKNIYEKRDKEPDKIVVSEDIRNIILKRIGELTEEQKQVIILRDIDGLSYEEISKVLKISVSAVKSKLFRARENLREKLEKDGIL